MAWKTVKGYRYYYRKGQYVAGGLYGELEALLDQERQQEREYQRAALEALAEEDRTMAGLLDQAQGLAKAYLIAAGWYQHKGQWRRRNDRTDSD